MWDLVKPSNPKRKPEYQSLLDLITSCIYPTTWDIVGGAASIEYCRGSLLVSQLDDAHIEIEQLLESVRESMKTMDQHIFYPNGFDRYQAEMQKKISVSFEETPLRDVVVALRNTISMPIVVSHRSLAEAGVDPTTPISLEVDNLPVRSVLKLLLDPLEIAAFWLNESLFITSLDEAECNKMAVVYSVDDIICPNSIPADKQNLDEVI